MGTTRVVIETHLKAVNLTQTKCGSVSYVFSKACFPARKLDLTCFEKSNRKPKTFYQQNIDPLVLSFEINEINDGALGGVEIRVDRCF